MTMQNLLQQCRKKSHSKVLRFWVVLAAVALLLALACRGYDWDALGRYKGDNISSLHYVRGRVVEVLRDDTKPDQLDPARSMGTQELRILLLEGANKGTEVTIANYLTRTHNVRLRQGETAIICEDLPDSADAYYTVYNYDRAPVLVLIAACIFGMIYTGGFFEGVDFVTAFADCNASAGLVLGSSIALLFTFVFYRVRNVMTFQDFAACIPEGFKAMVSPMLILSLAWTLSGMTGLLGAKYYVANLLSGSAAALQYMLPVIIFLVAVFLAFATGTSWGTFSILIPIVCHAFPEGEMLVISIAACLSGAVCGDHCSPISDTTIMASAGAHCSHVNHVSTQLPYAITAASCAAVCYVITGIAQAFLGANGSLFTSLILLAVAIAVELVVLSVIRVRTNKKAAE